MESEHGPVGQLSVTSGKGVESVPEEEQPGLEAINRLPEVLVPKDRSPSVNMLALARSRAFVKIPEKVIQEDLVQRLRVDRIREAQEEEGWMRDLKAYLEGKWGDLSVESVRTCGKMSEDYDISEEGLLVYCPSRNIEEDDRGLTARLVISEKLQADFLNHYHTSLEGGRSPGDRTHLSSHSEVLSLKRIVPECAKLCGPLCGL